MAEDAIEVVMTPLNAIHGAMAVAHIRKKIAEQIQEKNQNQNKGSVTINCTFHFSKEYSIQDIATNLLVYMESGSGVRGNVSKYGSKFRCNLNFLWKDPEEAKTSFVFETLDQFIKGLIDKGLGEQVIAAAASVICDDVDVNTSSNNE
jgi:hypothetical protein